MKFWLSFIKILDSVRDIKSIVELFLMAASVLEVSKILFTIISMAVILRDNKLQLAFLHHKDRNTRLQAKE